MIKTIPTIKLESGEKFEIKRNRHIIAEIDKMQHDKALSDEDNQNFVILQDKYGRLETISKRVKELEAQYFETFATEDGEIYNRARAEYERVLADVTAFEIKTDGLNARIQRESINRIEAIVINALMNDERGNNIRSHEDAEEIWCTFVDEIGHESAKEWLAYTFNYLSGNDGENDDPFVVAQREKINRKANMRRGISKAR